MIPNGLGIWAFHFIYGRRRFSQKCGIFVEVGVSTEEETKLKNTLSGKNPNHRRWPELPQ